jgi:peptidoglycan L-alanyl-D-glutamate endopeptidase CwlK
MNSRHLTGHAVDLLALVGGKVSWDWPLYFRIAAAIRTAALELGIAVEWGGVWDQPLAHLSHDLEAEVAAYVRRRRGARKKANLDGPHFQLAWGAFPK